MTKLRRFVIQAVCAGLIFGAARFAADMQVLSVWPLVVAAGALASTMSHQLVARVVAWVIALGTAALAITAFHALGAAALLGLAAIGLTRVAFARLSVSSSSRRAKAYETAPTNPWNAVDQGIDPTL